jgi:hypothetical protein
MKNLIAAVVFVLSFIPFSTKADSINNWKEHSVKLISDNISNTFELVFRDGKWWIYEYNEDGGLVNIYPIDE